MEFLLSVWLGLAANIIPLPVPLPFFGDGEKAAADRPARIAWRYDYVEATRLAQQQHKPLLLFFYSRGADAARDAFESKALTRKLLAPHQDRFVWAKLPLNAQITVGGQQRRLLDDPAFACMYGRQGVAIIDYAVPDSPQYGYVVSQIPFKPGKYLTSAGLSVVLDLPPGSLTQRSMIYAVRVHPDLPRSTEGEFSGILASEAESHSALQAQIQSQGHHSWETRFHRINARLASHSSAREVVAESWGGEELIDACIECVHCWRQSSGHWDAVSSRHAVFGFDIRRGLNGVWYATGLFAN